MRKEIIELYFTYALCKCCSSKDDKYLKCEKISQKKIFFGVDVLSGLSSDFGHDVITISTIEHR